MRFDENFLDEIKARVRLSDVIGRTVKLKRQGREFAGLSPFSKEKTPSFFVNDDKGFWHDFSSNKHGDLISFLQETERLSFVEAVERLAAEAGVPMPAPDPRAAEVEQARTSLIDWMTEAAKWFAAELRRPVGAGARDYLKRRELPESDWARFGVGYAPAGRTGLKDHLVAKGAKPADLVEAGLLIALEDGGGAYDRFRDRIIFPILDARGRVISFGGRALDPAAKAKYLNGPDSPLFDKGRTLYGLPEARKLLHTGGAGAALIVVEGYMDVIACQRAGLAAVAPMGTALTEQQMETLWRLHPEPTLSFDGDGAGRRAAARAIDRALPLLGPGRSFRFSVVSGGKDPDDVLREQGAAALKAQLNQAVPLVEALYLRERDLEPLDTPERRVGLKARLRAAAALIADKEVAGAYREELLRRFDAQFQAAPRAAPVVAGRARDWRRDRNRPEYADAPSKPETRAAAQRLARTLEPAPAALALAALDDPARLDDHLETLEARGFGAEALDPLAQALVRLRLDGEDGAREALAGELGPLIGQVEQAAARAGASFLEPGLSLDHARALWTEAFLAQARRRELAGAAAAAKAGAQDLPDLVAFKSLKGARDRAQDATKRQAAEAASPVRRLTAADFPDPRRGGRR